MLILNTSAFAGKEEITFNGMSIQENEKGHHRISAKYHYCSKYARVYIYLYPECAENCKWRDKKRGKKKIKGYRRKRV